MKGRIFICLAIIALVLVDGEILYKASAGVSPAACKEERRLALNACKPVIYGRPPSAECCRLARVTHIECVCPIVTPKLAALIDVNRAVRLIEGCGRQVPRHYKCGSITTP